MNPKVKAKELTAEIINSLVLDKISDQKVEEYFRPNENPEISETLQLNLDGVYTGSITEYLDSINPKEMNFHKDFEDNIPFTDSMNPHVVPYPLEEYFVEKVGDKNLKHLDKLQNLLWKDKDSQVIPLIEYNRKRKGILHIGEKGSGKTFSQNIWIHRNNKIFEQNKIFWVRLDASKLLDIWKKSSSLENPNLTTIEEYFLGQMVYVFCKHFISDYPLKSELFVEIADKLSKSNSNKIRDSLFESQKQADASNSPYDIFAFYAQKKGITTIIDYLIDFERQIAIDEGLYLEEGRKDVDDRIHTSKSFLISKVLADSQQFETDRYKGSKRDWIEIGKLLREFILDNGYYLFYIVDGIDNINYYHASQKNFIDKILSGLYEFPLKERDAHDNELILISLRDTTFESLKKWKNEEHYDDRLLYKDVEAFYIIRQDSAGIQKPAFEKRINYVLSLTRDSNCFMQKVMRTMLEHHTVPDESRWNSNIRCFMNNHLSLAKLITFRYYFAGKPDNFNIKEQIDTFENINYLLNGELFLDEQSRTQLSNKGSNLFNIFGYIEKEINLPNYLIYTRLLQIIKRKPNITDEKLFLLTNIFDFDDRDTKHCLDKLVRSGMIKSSYSPNARDKINFVISSKGEFVLNIFFSDIHFLYYTCLNTPLPEEFIKKLMVSPNNFTNDRVQKKYYSPYCIITGVLFLQYLINWNNYRLEIVKNKDLGIDIESYQLPINFPALEESIEHMVGSSFKDEEYKSLLINYFSK